MKTRWLRGFHPIGALNVAQELSGQEPGRLKTVNKKVPRTMGNKVVPRKRPFVLKTDERFIFILKEDLYGRAAKHTDSL